MARSTHTHEVDESTLAQNNPEIAREIHIVKRSLARKDPEHDRYVESLRKQIEDGTYGVCDLTGNEIPLARLEAVPYATMTVEAQEKLEKGLI
mgnify:CR=1 FL=1